MFSSVNRDKKASSKSLQIIDSSSDKRFFIYLRNETGVTEIVLYDQYLYKMTAPAMNEYGGSGGRFPYLLQRLEDITLYRGDIRDYKLLMEPYKMFQPLCHGRSPYLYTTFPKAVHIFPHIPLPSFFVS